MNRRNSQIKIKLKITAPNRDDVAWMIEEIENHYFCVSSGVRPSDGGGAHALLTVLRELGVKGE